MAASSEWTEWHLTPRGWVRGTEKIDSGITKREAPPDRVLSVTFHEECNGYSRVHCKTTEDWKSTDHEAVNAFITKFGEAPRHL